MGEIDQFHQQRVVLYATARSHKAAYEAVEELRKQLLQRLNLLDTVKESQSVAMAARNKKYREILKKRYGSEQAAEQIVNSGLLDFERRTQNKRAFGEKTVL